MVPWNDVPTIFFNITKHICHYVWKIVRITLHCIIGLKLRGEGPKKYENFGTNVLLLFRNFSPRYKDRIQWNVVLKFFHTWWHIYYVWKLSEHNFNESLFPYRGEKVLRRITKFHAPRISECDVGNKVTP